MWLGTCFIVFEWRWFVLLVNLWLEKLKSMKLSLEEWMKVASEDEEPVRKSS
jgi:hypothetical protein